MTEKYTLFDALKAMSNDGVMMTPEGMQIDLLESKLTGSISTQKDLCAYMDNWISEVILSQEATSRTGATGAAANEREDVRLDLVQADADLLSDTLNSTLIEWICEFNGLTPCMVSRVVKKPEDLLAASQTDVNIASLGFKPTLESVRAKYGEGWEDAPPAPAPTNHIPGIGNMAGSAPGAPGAPPQAEPTSFAEPTSAKPALPTDPIAESMGKAGDALLSVWMGKIAELVQAAPTPAALRDHLVNAYGDLPTEQLQQIMALAFAAAELAGMDAVATETAQAQ